MPTLKNAIDTLLYPVTTMMGRISYVKKFALACAIFAIPFTVSTLLVLLGNQQEIDALSNKYHAIGKLKKIHTINRAFIGIRNQYGRNVDSPDITKDSVIIELLTLSGALDLPPTSPTYRALIRLQASAEVEFEGILNEGSTLYTRLNDINHILLQVNQLEELYISDNHIFNDSDMYSLNLVSLITYFFNSPISKMEKSKIIGASILKRGYIDSQGVNSLQDLSESLKSDSSRLLLRLKNTLNNDYISREQFSLYKQQLDGLKNLDRIMEDSITFDPSLTTDPSLFIDHCDVEINKLRELQSVLVNALLAQYQQRIYKLEQQQILNLILMCVVFMGAFYLLMGIFSSINHSLLALVSASKRLFDGDLATPISLSTRDEMFQLACHFEAMRIKLKDKGDQLLKATITDELTGLYNRRHFDSFLKRQLSQCEADRSDLILMIIDLDHFKKINDQYGHIVGDQCLQETASLLMKAITRKGDKAFRYGGEEFAIILPPVTNTNGEVIAERLCELFRSHTLTSPSISFTASIGIASTITANTYNANTLIALADKALYAAKDAGRDRYEIYQGARG